MGSVYLDFAKKNPEFYDLMFIIRAPMNCLEDNEGWQGGMKTFGYLINIVKECQALGQFFLHKDPETLAFTIWSAVHGIAALKIRGRCRVITEEKQEDIDIKSYQDLLLMLSKN